MSNTNKIQGSTFIFTGTLTELNREEVEALVKAHGGKVLSGVSGKLNYLVVGEDPGSKLEKAKKLGSVKILTEKEFLVMLPEGTTANISVASNQLSKDSKTGSSKSTTKKTKSVAEKMPCELVVSGVCKILDKIIIDFLPEFKKEYEIYSGDGSGIMPDFKVYPGYGYDKFYLSNVEGSYDMSLQGLIHYILYEEGFYKKFLNEKQFKEVKKVIKDYPDSIYGPSDEDEDYEKIQYDYLDVIYSQCIKFVAYRLIENGFNVKSIYYEYLPSED
jgi:hypothetical protein